MDRAKRFWCYWARGGLHRCIGGIFDGISPFITAEKPYPANVLADLLTIDWE